MGVKGRKKHEKNQSDSKVSVTVVECGNSAGTDGPSVYLPTGQQIPEYLRSQFGNSMWLRQSGAPPDSFVQMTPSGFMTNHAWDEMAEKLAKGIRNMVVIRDHPELWAVLHLDGFKSHVMTYEAQQTFRRYKILVVKENGHSSQVNQAFDQEPAKQGKSELRRWLPVVRDKPGLVKAVCQWTLLLVVMAGQDGGRGKAWTSGFIRVNLHPKQRLPIEVWLSKISSALLAAGGTELSNENPYGVQHLRLIKVPEFYAQLPPFKQKELKDLLGTDSFDWSMDSIKALPEWCQSLFYKSDNLYEYFKFAKHMETCVQNNIALQSDLTPSDALRRLHQASPGPPKASAAPQSQKEQNRASMVRVGLASYDIFSGQTFTSCCKDKDVVCDVCFQQREAAFSEVCLQRSRNAGNTPSKSLLLCASPDQERAIFAANARDVSIGAFLDSALDVNLGKGLASRKLNLLGEIDGVAGIVNSEEGLRRRRQAAQLARSLEAIKLSKQQLKNRQKKDKQVKAAARKEKLQKEAPIFKLLTESGVLPWVVPGKAPSNQITVNALKKYISDHRISGFLPRVNKPSSKPSLMRFVGALCEQQKANPGFSVSAQAKAARSAVEGTQEREGEEEEENFVEEKVEEGKEQKDGESAAAGEEGGQLRRGKRRSSTRLSNPRRNRRPAAGGDEDLAERLQFDEHTDESEADQSESESKSDLTDQSEAGQSESESRSQSDSLSEISENESDSKTPHWKKMGLKVGHLVVLNGGKGNKWWVGKVLELREVVWDEANAQAQPELYQGDILVHTYTGVGVNATFRPGKGTTSRVSKPVWAECADQWGAPEKILNEKGKLKSNVRSLIGTAT